MNCVIVIELYFTLVIKLTSIDWYIYDGFMKLVIFAYTSLFLPETLSPIDQYFFRDCFMAFSRITGIIYRLRNVYGFGFLSHQLFEKHLKQVRMEKEKQDKFDEHKYGTQKQGLI